MPKIGRGLYKFLKPSKTTLKLPERLLQVFQISQEYFEEAKNWQRLLQVS